MSCIDKKISDMEADEKAHTFVHGKMSEAEEDAFADHILECKSCGKLADYHADLLRLKKLSDLKDSLEPAIKSSSVELIEKIYSEIELLGGDVEWAKAYVNDYINNDIDQKSKQLSESGNHTFFHTHRFKNMIIFQQLQYYSQMLST